MNAKLFWGFFLTNTMNFNSGNRYNITTGNDDNGDGIPTTARLQLSATRATGRAS